MLYRKEKTNKKRQEFRLMPLPLFLLDAYCPDTSRVVVNELIKQPINQSFYL
jgi:hypothetical protein